MADLNQKFDKAQAFDELSEALKVQNLTPSEGFKAMQRAMDFLEKIHFNGYQKGYVDGIEISSNIDKDENK